MERRPLWQPSDSLPDKGKPEAMLHYLVRLIVLFIFLFAVLQLSASPGASRNTRQTVAVVLSGGGARGMAHIGVLKALEENNIPIDYIAGTSIGAIVGGMYAAGYSPEEIESLVLSEKFSLASAGRVNPRYRQYYLQRPANPAWFRLFFGWEDRLEPQNILRQNIPGNIVSPYPMDFMFMEYLGPAGAAANFHFDNLFVPFRCIATDVEGRSARTMRDGSLPDAVRASMTFPFYFKPIDIDGRLMMDGGMFNNFPADVVIDEFMPDIVIGSVVSGNPPPPKRDDIISQLENLLMHPSEYDIRDQQGKIIRPNVPNIAVNDMSRNVEIIDSGYVATWRAMPDILELVSPMEHPENREIRRAYFQNSIPDRIIGTIEVTGLNSSQTEFVLSKLGDHSLPMTLEQFRENYLTMITHYRFDYSYPYLRYDTKTGLFVVCLEMQKDKEMVRSFGGNLSSRQINHLYGDFEYVRWGRTPLSLTSSLHLGNFYSSIQTSARLDFPGTTPFFLTADMVFSRWEYASNSLVLLEEQHPPFLTNKEFLTRLSLGYPLQHHTKMEFGGAYVGLKQEFYNTRNFAEGETMDVSGFRPLYMFGAAEKNTLNHSQYPTRGSFFHTSFRLLFGKETYTPGSTAVRQNAQERTHAWAEGLLQYKRFFLPGHRFNPGFSAELFLSQRPLFSTHTTTMAMTRQYNPFPLASTLFMPNFKSNKYAAAGIKSIYNLSSSVSIQAEAHLFQSFQSVSTTNQNLTTNNYWHNPLITGNLALVFHTPPGPLSISLSYFQNESETLAFMINFGHIIFNKQSFM